MTINHYEIAKLPDVDAAGLLLVEALLKQGADKSTLTHLSMLEGVDEDGTKRPLPCLVVVSWNPTVLKAVEDALDSPGVYTERAIATLEAAA